MNLAAWARRSGGVPLGDCLSLVSCWAVAGVARRVGRLIVVDGEAGLPVCTAVYARVSSIDQKADLDRQVTRVTVWPMTQQLPVDIVVVEAGSALDGRRRKFLALLRDPAVTQTVVEHRDRFFRFGSEYIQAAWAAEGRDLVVVDLAEVDDDPSRDVAEIPTSMCVGLYDKRAARNRAERALVATDGVAA